MGLAWGSPSSPTSSSSLEAPQPRKTAESKYLKICRATRQVGNAVELMVTIRQNDFRFGFVQSVKVRETSKKTGWNLGSDARHCSKIRFKSNPVFAILGK
jgi:hypothetical protein